MVALATRTSTRFADLKGKSLVTQPKGNTAELLTDTVLKVNGLNYQSLAKINFQASYTDAVSMMKDGHAQVFTLGTTAPASAVMDLASARDITLVAGRRQDHGRAEEGQPGLQQADHQGRHLSRSRTKDVPVIGYSTHIIAACDLPEEHGLQMMKTMAANVGLDVRGHQGDRRRHAEGHGASTSACRSTRARRSSTRKPARCNAPMPQREDGAARPPRFASEERSTRSDENAATAPATRALKWIVAAIAVAMSLYHMYVAAFGPPEALIFRGTHLMFALTLVFLLYPSRPAGGAGLARARRWLLLGSGSAFVLHIFLNYEYFTNRIIYIDELTVARQVLRGGRRAGGARRHAPRARLGAAAHRARVPGLRRLFSPQVKLPVLMEQLYLSTEGIFGSTLGVSASYVMLFVLFGAFMERSGTGQLFMDFALSITGHTAGGPGKVAVVSSSACSAPSRAARWPT